MLTAPLRDRFVNREHLDFYEDDELAEIVTRNAKKLRTEISPDATREIALRSRGTPRKANNLLRWARDYATSKSNGCITTPVAGQAFEMLEVDQLGLERQDRRYLETLIGVFTGGPAGIQALSHSMNVPADTLEDEVEPFLLRLGFVQRTPRGRMITAAALAHLGLELPPKDRTGQRRLF
jgi:Holliday junction DNA helicase RuvB